MSRFPPSNPSKLEGFDTLRKGASLILSSQPASPVANLRPKREETNHHRQHPTINRYNSEQQLRRPNYRPLLATSEINPRTQDHNHVEKPLSKFYQASHIGNSSNQKPKQDLLRTNAASKGSTIGEGKQQLRNHRSQKAIPSFLRNNKTPDKTRFMPRKGITKDNFKIIRRLGQGKFGSVFMALQLNTGMIFALKMMNKQKILQDNLLVQFVRQLKIQTFLEHPNIIKNYGWFSDQQHFYTIMQLGCDGELYDIMNVGEPLSQESTSFIIGSLLNAVNTMHGNKILHRDIKPQNIVLIHGIVKLCDFGWAVNKKQELRSTFCGTPLYLSPELLQGERYDEKVDIWAIGVLAFELHLATSPFSIVDQDDLKKIVTDEVQFPPNSKASKEFKEFIHQILRKDPKDRLTSKQLLSLDFIRNYQQFETCQDLCQ